MIGSAARERAPVVARRAPESVIRAAMIGSEAGGRDRPRDRIDLALGEPCWRPHRIEASRDPWWEPRGLGYGPQVGEPELRAEIAQYEGVSADEVLVTAGAQAALFSAVQTFVGPGDAVLVPDPGFPAYRSLAELAGGTAVPYALADGSFDLDAARLLEVLGRTPRVRMVVLNHPSNPTGGLASRDALRRLAEVCTARSVVLLADEVYRELHDGHRPARLRDVTATGLVVSSMSKAFAAPGLRVGWLLGDPALLEPCRRLHALATTHAAAPSQAHALALLRSRDEALPAARRELARRWRALEEGLGAEGSAASGSRRVGLYRWLEVGGDDVELCRRALRRGVAVVPGSVFGRRGRGFVRVSLGEAPAAIRAGVRRLRPLVGTLASRGVRTVT